MLEAAVDLADREGIDAVSMRRLGQELGIEAMSLYTHIRGKEDLLDGIVDVVVAEIPVDTSGSDWRTTLRRQILAARSVMLRHRWAARIIETRSEPGMATLAYMEAATGIIRDGGFTVDLTHHAMHVLGSRVLGFNQDLYDDSGVPDPRSRRHSPPRSRARIRTSPRSRGRRATRAASAAATTTTSSPSGSTSSSTGSSGGGSADRESDQVGADLPEAHGRRGVV